MARTHKPWICSQAHTLLSLRKSTTQLGTNLNWKLNIWMLNRPLFIVSSLYNNTPCAFQHSFFLQTIRDWNALPDLSLLLKVPRTELLSLLLWWELGTDLPGSGEWLSFWHVTSKQFWFWYLDKELSGTVLAGWMCRRSGFDIGWGWVSDCHSLLGDGLIGCCFQQY